MNKWRERSASNLLQRFIAGSMEMMASSGGHVLTFSGDRIDETTQNVMVDGMEHDLRSVSVKLRSGDSTMLLLSAISVMAAVTVVAFAFIRMKE